MVRVPVRSLRSMPDRRGVYTTARTWLRDVRRRRGLSALQGLAGPTSSREISAADRAALRRLMILCGYS